MTDDDDKPLRPRIALRINGARVGDRSRPLADRAATGYRDLRPTTPALKLGRGRPLLRVHGSRPGGRPPDDDEAAS